jgi:hypothetical protein
VESINVKREALWALSNLIICKFPLDFFFDNPENLLKIKNLIKPGVDKTLLKEASYVVANLTATKIEKF